MPSVSSVVKNVITILCRVLILWPCHRYESRSPCVCGIRLPICFRCLGIIFGLPVSFVLVILLDIKTRLIGMSFCIPLMLDVTMQYHLEIMSNNIRRSVTGFCFGIGVGIYLITWCANKHFLSFL